MTDLYRYGVLDLAAALRQGDVTSVELVHHLLTRIDAHDGVLHSFVTVDGAGALAGAALADAERAAGTDRGVLHGVPVVVKDNLATAGLPTTYNSRALADAVPTVDSPAVARLRAAGAIVLGKTNLNEFAWSLPSEDDLTPPVRNPWQPRYASIGSSSGSAAAVAAGFAPAALGTDGGGSTRLPAGQHGLVGLKPSRGAVPRAPSSVDVSVVGVLGRTARDVAAVYDVIANVPAGQPDAIRVPGLRLGVPRALIEAVGLEDEMSAAFEETVAVLRRLGVRVTDVSLPELAASRAATFLLIAAGAFADREDLLRQRLHLVGRSARRYQLSGASIPAADVLRAQRVARLAADALHHRLSGLDGVLTPLTPFVTAEAARVPREHSAGRNAAFTAPFNLVGWPAVAIPSARSATGLPIGFQVAARPGTEPVLLAVAHAYGAATGVEALLAPL